MRPTGAANTVPMFTVTAAPAVVGLPSTGVGGRVKDALTVGVPISLLAAFGVVTLLLGEAERRRRG